MENKPPKTLIYMYRSQLKPTGGPIGYNYNLMLELDKQNNTGIEYINGHNADVEKVKSIINNVRFKWARDLLNIFKRAYKYGRLLYKKEHFSEINLNEYSIIHFHSTYDMYLVRDSLANYEGLIILTSHSPTILSKEICDSLSKIEKRLFRHIYSQLIKMDEYAFTRADYIVFPCEEAKEPYIHAWDQFQLIPEEKFRYLLTGIQRCYSKLSREEICIKYGIPSDAYIISYVGRHNIIKGYDRFKKIGEKLLEYDINIYILVAGTESPISGLKQERWIEVGWTDDPHSIIASSDVYVLTNRETYFDLALLEALSLGAIVVASNTGGNKFFSKIGTESVRLFDTDDQCVDLIMDTLQLDDVTKSRLHKASRSAFEQFFTSQTFCKNYINLINSLNYNQ